MKIKFKFLSALIFVFIISFAVALPSLADEAVAAAYSASDYDGNEADVFAPASSDSIQLFPIDADNWTFTGLCDRSGTRANGDITFAYAGINAMVPEGGEKTEFTLDLSQSRCDMGNYKTLAFGIALIGLTDRLYDVEAVFYSGSEKIIGDAYVGVGWNMFYLDISAASGMASHVKITISYDDEVPMSVRISSPYAMKSAAAGFVTAEKYSTDKLTATEGQCTQRSGKIKPESGRAVLEGNFVTTEKYGAGDTVYFEFSVGGVNSGNFTLGLTYKNNPEKVYSNKISLSGTNADGSGIYLIPMTLSGDLYGFSMQFDNVSCDVLFDLNYVRLHAMPVTPAEAVPEIGSLTKITKTTDGLVLSGSMERAAVSQYSSDKGGDGLLRFYALDSLKMDDISAAVEIGSIKLTTVFEYTVKLSDYPSVGDFCMFFAAVKDSEGNILPLSKPRFADAPSLGENTVSNVGLFQPATVGAFESNASRVIVDIPLDEFLIQSEAVAGTVLSYTVYTDDGAQKRTVKLDSEKLSGLDADIGFYISAGIRVYLRFSAYSPIENLTYGAQNCDSYSFYVDDSESRAFYTALVRFFAKRYPGIKGFQTGIAVNLEKYTGADLSNVSSYVSSLADMLRLTYNAASDYLDAFCVIVPFMDVGGQEDHGGIPTETLSIMLSSRLSEIGQIPIVMMYSFDELEDYTELPYAVCEMASELECAEFGGIMYFYEPTLDYLNEKYGQYLSGFPEEGYSYTDFTAQAYTELTEKLGKNRTRGVFFSMENTNLQNNHDFYSYLKHAGESGRYVYDAAAKPAGDSYDSYAGCYRLFDFSDKYYPNGWIGGGGVESCLTDYSYIYKEENGGSSRVLTAEFKKGDYSGISGAAGITLCNFSDTVDMSQLDLAVFDIALVDSTNAKEEIATVEKSGTVVFVIGTDETRAEYYAEDLLFGRTYSLECALGGYENLKNVDYIGIMVYSDSELKLELSSVELYSDTIGSEDIKALFEEKPESQKSPNYKGIALFAFTVAAVTILIFVFMARVEREEEEEAENQKRTAVRTEGEKSEQKFRR